MSSDGPPLNAVERTAVAVCEYVNRNPAAKRLQTLFQRNFSNRWINAILAKRFRFVGLENAVDLAPDRGVLLCANHRSFFDQYALMSVLYRRATWPERCYFPVRSNFFYEAWSGLLVNGIIGGFVMWPPVFRDTTRATLNRHAIDEICEVIGQPGTVVGMHPEGTRGKGPDPYELLPAHPGVGQVIMRARPIVLPAFINGMGNEIVTEMTTGVTAGLAARHPIICVFGPPVDFGALLEGNPRPAQYKRVADRLLEEIRKLGELERRERARLAL